MITSNKELRATKLYERTIAKREYNEGFELIRYNAFSEIIEQASNIDFIIENNYDESFEKDLKHLCQEIIIGGRNENIYD
jgi:hypothetical protein